MSKNAKHSYKPDQPYKTRGGYKAIFLGENTLTQSQYRFVFATDNFYLATNEHGRILSSKHSTHGDDSWCANYSEYDIIGEWQPEPKKVEGWINFYKTDLTTSGYCFRHIFHTQKEANLRASPDRIACKFIEFTEGEGL